MARLIEQVGPCGLAPRPLGAPFRALSQAIVYQQLSGKAAATIHRRLLEAVSAGKPLTPQAIAEAPDALLRGAGLSRSKTAALRDLAARTLTGELPTAAKLRRMTDEEVVESLTQVRGIGPWTVQMLLIFQLGRPDVLPVTDLGVRKGFMFTYKLPDLPSDERLERSARRWRPYRSIASWYLWRAVELHRPAQAVAQPLPLVRGKQR